MLNLRHYRSEDAARLYDVFHDAVHGLARHYYNAAQCQAWAPEHTDPHAWAARMAQLRPIVACEQHTVIGYGSVHVTGYIDHFFVASRHARQGVGSALLRALESQARRRTCERLEADVSLAAQDFFRHHGFVIVRRQIAEVRGVSLENARMRKLLTDLPHA